MPRKKGQEHLTDAPYPITPAEVRDLVTQSDKRRQLSVLDESCYIALAVWLSNMTLSGYRQRTAPLRVNIYQATEADMKYRARWEDAVRLLRKTRNHGGSFTAAWNVEKASVILETAFDEVTQLLSPSLGLKNAVQSQSALQRKKWVWAAMPIVFTMAELVKDCGGRGGTSRNSVSVNFAALALERIGWRDEHGRAIKASAIARHCAEPRPAHNDHNLP